MLCAKKNRSLIWERYHPKRIITNPTASVLNIDSKGQDDGGVSSDLFDVYTNDVSCVPILWNSLIILNTFLFHCVLADVMLAAHEFMTHHNLLATFERLVNLYLNKLQLLRLDLLVLDQMFTRRKLVGRR